MTDNGLLASRGELPGGPLYFVSAIDDRTRLACLASDDNGATWYEYAVSDRKFPHRVYSIGGARELTSDGSIIGTFTDVAEGAKKYTEPQSGAVYFFKIQAGWSSARIASVSFEAGTLQVVFTDMRGQPKEIRFLQDDGGWTKWLPFTEKQTVRTSPP